MNKHINRLYDGSGILAARIGSRALTGSIGAIGLRAAIAVTTAPAIITEAHRQPLIMPAAGLAWCWAAWRASPLPADTPSEHGDTLTCDDDGQKGPSPEAGEGMTIIKTVNGTAVITDHPTQPGRRDIHWKDTA